MVEEKPMGMVGLVEPRWCDHPAGAVQPAHKALSEGHLTTRTNKSTLLDDAVRGFWGTTGEDWVAEAG
jgi:hypothetical protein